MVKSVGARSPSTTRVQRCPMRAPAGNPDKRGNGVRRIFQQPNDDAVAVITRRRVIATAAPAARQKDEPTPCTFAPNAA